jgi:hypothetical protein
VAALVGTDRPVTAERLVAPVRRPGPLSILQIVASVGASIAISVAMDVTVFGLMTSPPGHILIVVPLFNATCVLWSLVGGVIEWRRPGHTIGRLLMLSGPAYGFVSAVWNTADTLQTLIDPRQYLFVSWIVILFSYPVIALMAGWVPLLFPTGRLPGPRWRRPVSVLIVSSGIGLAAFATRPGSILGTTYVNPFGVAGWPDMLQPFVDLIPLEVVALLALGTAAVIIRYRRGDRIERLQIRWLASAVIVIVVGFGATVVSFALGNGNPPITLTTTLIGYVGILLMPVAIGIAILRYRLFEIDRIISRTIGWAVVTGILGVVFAGTIVGLQGLLAGVTQAQTLAVAASTLVAFVLFQPLRRRVQAVVDHRFNRARYDAERTATAFADRQRDQVNIAGLKVDITSTIDAALSPRTVAVWIRPSARGGPL